MCCAALGSFRPEHKCKERVGLADAGLWHKLEAMRILCVHAHFDDYEFVASGTFELWKRKLGDQVRTAILVCTDGRAGHQFRTREELHRIRVREQQASAVIGGYELEILRLPSGE